VPEVIWWDEGPLPPPLDQPPAVEALEVVMMGAQPVEQVEHGEVAGSPVHPMIGLQPGRS
jgi:hypothetical protein